MSALTWFELTPRFVNEPEEWHSRKHNCRLVVQSRDGKKWSGFVDARLLNTGRRMRVREFSEADSLAEAQALCELLADAYADERGVA